MAQTGREPVDQEVGSVLGRQRRASMEMPPRLGSRSVEWQT